MKGSVLLTGAVLVTVGTLGCMSYVDTSKQQGQGRTVSARSFKEVIAEEIGKVTEEVMTEGFPGSDDFYNRLFYAAPLNSQRAHGGPADVARALKFAAARSIAQRVGPFTSTITGEEWTITVPASAAEMGARLTTPQSRVELAMDLKRSPTNPDLPVDEANWPLLVRMAVGGDAPEAVPVKFTRIVARDTSIETATYRGRYVACLVAAAAAVPVDSTDAQAAPGAAFVVEYWFEWRDDRGWLPVGFKVTPE